MHSANRHLDPVQTITKSGCVNLILWETLLLLAASGTIALV